jgi:uncharacterized RDD family membrane protein YckC
MSLDFVRVSLGRRMAALLVDWLSCYFIVAAFTGGLGASAPYRGWNVLALFFAEIVIFSAIQGATVGHRVFGIRIIRFSGGGPISPIQALVRSALLITVIFAITFDENGRGLHERFSGTVLTRGKNTN